MSSAAASRGFSDARRTFDQAFDTRFAGWGVVWSDLDLDGDLDVVLANGAIPIRNLARDREPVQVLQGNRSKIVDVSASVLGKKGVRVNGRGLAAADYDNDGDVDVAINSIAEPLALLRSSGSRGRWLEVAFERFSPGARVTVELTDGRRLVREVAGREQLPFFGGPARALRPWPSHDGQGADRPFPGRPHLPSRERSRKPGRDGPLTRGRHDEVQNVPFSDGLPPGPGGAFEHPRDRWHVRRAPHVSILKGPGVDRVAIANQLKHARFIELLSGPLVQALQPRHDHRVVEHPAKTLLGGDVTLDISASG